MNFQTLDNKNGCVSTCLDGSLFFDQFPKNKTHLLTRTWDYAEFLEDLDVKYAQLYAQGQSLNEVCPPELDKQWQKVYTRLRAFGRACLEAQLDMHEHCFYHLVPSAFLVEYCAIKDRICNHVFETYAKPKNYSHLLRATKLLTDIKYRQLNIDQGLVRELSLQADTRLFISKLKKAHSFIDYNLFASKTGRLGTHSRSFPILTFDKRVRSVLRPVNDLFIEFDLNAAELRVFFALAGVSAPDVDVYTWLAGALNTPDRETTKKIVLRWFYSPETKHPVLDELFDRPYVTSNFWDGSTVRTIFERELYNVEAHYALNYTIQSTTSDIVVEQACDLRNTLKGTPSFVSFLMHDSIVLDVTKDEAKRLNEFKTMFESTRLGKLKTSVKVGTDYGTMEEV